MSTLRNLSLLALPLLSHLSMAQPVVIDFEGLPSMPHSPPGQNVPDAARLSAGFAAVGVVFASEADHVAVVHLGEGHATSGVLGIAGVAPDNTLSYAKNIYITFVSPDDSEVPAITSSVSIRGDLGGNPDQSVTMRAFDWWGRLLGEVTAPDSGGQTLSLQADGIHGVTIVGTTDVGGVAWDDLVFETVVPIDPCLPDLTGDGQVNTLDFLLFLGAWAQREPFADWDGNGTINTQDFLAYLNDWVAGC
ncbi:MAG: GC-type dockerin domain-anchored protein [Phycisphaerales bacterium JB054]